MNSGLSLLEPRRVKIIDIFLLNEDQAFPENICCLVLKEPQKPTVNSRFLRRLPIQLLEKLRNPKPTKYL